MINDQYTLTIALLEDFTLFIIASVQWMRDWRLTKRCIPLFRCGVSSELTDENDVDSFAVAITCTD